MGGLKKKVPLVGALVIAAVAMTYTYLQPIRQWGEASLAFAERLGEKLDGESRTALAARSDAWLARARTDDGADSIATGGAED